MTWKFSSVFTFCFSFVFWSVIAVHYAQVKTPTHAREIASWSAEVRPIYDANWKY